MSLNGIWKQIERLGKEFKNYLEVRGLGRSRPRKGMKRPRRGLQESKSPKRSEEARGPEEAGKRSRSLEKLRRGLSILKMALPGFEPGAFPSRPYPLPLKQRCLCPGRPRAQSPASDLFWAPGPLPGLFWASSCLF